MAQDLYCTFPYTLFKNYLLTYRLSLIAYKNHLQKTTYLLIAYLQKTTYL